MSGLPPSPKHLDASRPQKVSYAIPIWLRDEQVKLALARPIKRLQQAETLSEEPVAVVGYGPSLRETWDQIRDFKIVFSCSGSHRFLIDRGIIPTYHTAVDPLQGNTVRLIGEPHPSVKYLICSTCHPDVFEHLKDYDVTLWHSFPGEEEGLRILPRGEWAITGGPDVGLRTLSLARFLGYRNVHVFGLDGSSPTADGGRHAADHPNPLKSSYTVEWNGRTFNTTPSMLEAARLVEHELQQLPDLQVTFYGDGLIQHMAKSFQPFDRSRTSLYAYNWPDLISPEMREQNMRLHQTIPEYGVGGAKHVGIVLSLVKALPVKAADGTPPSVLDYGCGKGALGRDLPFPIYEYDPAIPGKQESPRPADLVVCTDVLEHVEPDKMNFVLNDLSRCVKQLGYFVIHTGAAKKTYPDGRNTHLTQRGFEWWTRKLGKHFTVAKSWPKGPEVHFLVAPLPTKTKRMIQAMPTVVPMRPAAPTPQAPAPAADFAPPPLLAAMLLGGAK